ncbi:MAG: chloride channel protein, partial [Bacillota bacterium]|nr:chloride channel protein [Bacillota bacterium]
AKIGMSATLSVIFASPLFGLVAPFEEENMDITLPKKAKMVLYFAAIFGGLGIFALLNKALGAPMAMAHFSAATIGNREFLWFVPLNLLGIIAGYLYHFSGKLVAMAFKPMACYPVIKAVIGGAILGGVGIFLPFTMFAGETQMEIIMEEWQTMAVTVLFLTGFIKLIVGNVCLYSGWRGGNIFPIIFSGVCLGYAMAAITGIDSIFAVIVTTASLSAMVMRKPLMTTMVLILCFPISNFLVLLLSAVIGSAFPLPKFITAKGE